MTRPADRRVHHAEPLQRVVAVRRHLREMVQQHLAGREVAEVLQVVQFLRGGDVQDMRRPAGGARQRHQPTRAKERGLLVAPFHVAAIRIAGLEQRPALLQPIFVLGVIRDSPAPGPHHALQVFVVLHQQVAGRAAGEDLDAAHAAAKFQLRELGDVLLGAADVQPDVAPGFALDVVLLPRQLLGIDDRRRGVRHVEHRRQPAQHGGACAGGNRLDRLVAGIAQMHVRIDQAGQHVQPFGVDRFVRRGVRGDTERGDTAVAHADIGGLDAPGQDAGAVADQQIEMGWHGSIPCACRSIAPEPAMREAVDREKPMLRPFPE